MSNQLVAEASTSTTHTKQETNIQAFSGIQTLGLEGCIVWAIISYLCGDNTVVGPCTKVSPNHTAKRFVTVVDSL
jgi:hypothetical protein